MSETRTTKSIKNIKVSTLLTILSFVLAFINRQVFIDGLGIEIQGLKTSLGGMLSMLSLAELGIGTAVATTLYKPLHDGDHETLNELVSLQGWLYRRVCMVVLFGAAILLCFFHQIFAELGDKMWYAYVMFITSIIGTILSYTSNYKTILLSADQKGYKISRVTAYFSYSVSIIQVLILKYVEDPFLLWMGIGFAWSLANVWFLNYIVYKEYPWLNLKLSNGRQYFKKYPQVVKKTGWLFVHSITGVALSFTTPYVIQAVATLAVVGGYDNYNNLKTNVRTLYYLAFNSIGAGVGSLVAEGNKEKIYSFFWELLSIKYYMAGVCVAGLFLFASDFVALWLGSEYILATDIVLLISLIAYIDLTRGAVDAYIVANGLFSDIWAPAVEGAINIACSIALGLLIGWKGALIGSLISLLCVVVLWKPYFLFSRVFTQSHWEYWRGVFKFHTLSLGLIGVFYLLKQSLAPSTDTWLMFFISLGWMMLLYVLILFALFYIFSPIFRKGAMRTWHIILITLKLEKA